MLPVAAAGPSGASTGARAVGALPVCAVPVGAGVASMTGDDPERDGDDSKDNGNRDGDAPREPTAETWEQVARRALARRAHSHRHAVDDATRALADALHDGDPVTDDDVWTLRTAVGELQAFVESEVVEVAGGGVEPWRGALDHVPRGALADALGVTMADVNAIKAGEVDVGDGDGDGEGDAGDGGGGGGSDGGGDE